MKLRLSVFVALAVVCVAARLEAAEAVLEWRSGGWKYCDRDPGQGRRWQTADFDDSNWPEGTALLGYGDRDIQTQLSFGGNPQNKFPAAFFRRRLRVPRHERFQRYLGKVRCDDGAVVYVNGKEVYRHNMPAGRVTNTTYALRAFATDTKTERHAHRFLVDSQVIHAGENLIAVSVHQANPTSSDLAFDMELVGLETEAEVREAQSSIQDSATPPHQSRQAHIQSGPVFEFTVTSP